MRPDRGFKCASRTVAPAEATKTGDPIHWVDSLTVNNTLPENSTQGVLTTIPVYVPNTSTGLQLYMLSIHLSSKLPWRRVLDQ